MCPRCESSALTYADVYNELYTQPDKETWASKKLKNAQSACMGHRAKLLRHLTTALATQRCMSSCVGTVFHRELSREVENERKVVKTRMKRLARSMLRHSYRPSGRNFYRSMREFYRREDETRA